MLVSRSRSFDGPSGLRTYIGLLHDNHARGPLSAYPSSRDPFGSECAVTVLLSDSIEPPTATVRRREERLGSIGLLSLAVWLLDREQGALVHRLQEIIQPIVKLNLYAVAINQAS